ncbi:hypothetical protein FOWG_18209 [Fusarium oxysporum f. sp. lycopersici MN25]|nr:hypothetical protein FOWG_18209 [Fusarium oxysporum f. sp. lycopersici MN25]EWZ77376.1 hypothetical protein FOWG_18209 [Fusarium oxysporum f. sp. lycopersici MN25]EWZ77377.1 hypothetical protein FOWG_18209 [Fusarium oxysporum f. sp. lycopersici MN25]EWZ77378.1 hypothetical protein FOWG_18209 [Fusarium oxysporum f. sp. lycopersici MN25]EWZ77379.1 hypothetical protein FOWG_18209 [Fusarium oxysporum f. sp. lycopersici MN25]
MRPCKASSTIFGKEILDGPPSSSTRINVPTTRFLRSSIALSVIVHVGLRVTRPGSLTLFGSVSSSFDSLFLLCPQRLVRRALMTPAALSSSEKASLPTNRASHFHLANHHRLFAMLVNQRCHCLGNGTSIASGLGQKGFKQSNRPTAFGCPFFPLQP